MENKYSVIYWYNNIKCRTMPASFDKAMRDKEAVSNIGRFGYIQWTGIK